MTVADALPRLEQVCVTGAVHVDYARTVELATLYRRLATGKDLALEMRRMASRETQGEFDSRVRMTTMTVPASWNQGRTPFYETARLRGGTVTKRYDYDEAIPVTEADRRRQRLTVATDGYYSHRPIESYLAEHLTKSACMSDPNAWLLTVFAPFDFRTQVAQPYPVLIPCEAAVDFSLAAGVTQQFTARLSIAQSPTAYRYTCYLDNQAIDCWPILYEGSQGTPTLPEGSVLAGAFREVTTDGSEGKVLYQYRVLTHRAGRVPASVLGYVVDEEGSGASFVSPLHAGVPFLKQMLKVGSENDIVMTQMAFPVRAAYVPDCTGSGLDASGQNHTCVNGMDPITLLACSTCGGTGKLPVAITSLETLTMSMPKPGDEVKVKPADLMAFIGPSTENPKLQLDYLESRRQLFMQAIFGKSDADRVAGAATATQRQIELQEKLTALAPFADWLAGTQVYHTHVSAGYTDTAGGLTAVYEFPADLEQTQEADLYDLRKLALDSGADASTLEAIDARIATKQFADDAAALNKNQVKRRFITFLGYTIEQVNSMYALGGIRKNDWLARVNADIIFGELEIEKPEFYQLAYAAQVPLVQAKIDAIASGLPASGAMPRMNLSPLTQPVAATPAPAADFPAKGQRVEVKAGMAHHMGGMTMGGKGTVEVISPEPALGVRLDSMPDEVHKWYTASELEPLKS